MFSVTRNIQKLKRPTNVYLQEVGAFEKGTIAASAKQLEADMTLYTNIGVSHIESYGSREALAQDKLSLSTYGKPDGTVFINYDDEILTAYPFTQNVITYSLENENAMYFAKDITITENAGLKFTIVDRPAGEEHRAEVFVPGRHNVLNAVAAFAVGKALKLKPEEILSGISAYRPAGMRQNIIHPCGYNIFADCYNSSLLAIENTLGAMDDILVPPGGRRIAVLGDILGLGDISEETHRQIAEVLSNHKIDLLLGYGDSIRFTVSEASKLGIEAKYFENRIELESEILNTIRPEDLVLYNASHDNNLGASIDRLFGTDINESSNIAHKKFYLKVQGDFEYYIFETSASVKTYLGTDKRVEIPSHIEAEITDELHNITETRLLGVEKIGKTAFRENTHIREVVLPPTVVRIRDGAFKGSSIRRFEGTESLLSIGDEAFAECDELERVLMLRVVDTLWMDHLDEMEHVKREIGLRAYGQHDPVLEYRNVGSELYENMLDSIKKDTVRYVLSAMPRVKIEREQVAKPLDTGGDGSLGNTPKRAKKEPGRNDPCPCGSGKKYKNCCGKNK